MWTGGITSAVAAWVGLALSLRRYQDEQPKIKFLFEAEAYLGCYDEENGEYSVPAIGVTITNVGSKAVALDRALCHYWSAHDPDEPKKRELDLGRFKVVRGEPKQGWVRLYEKPVRIESISVRDTTGKVWTPSRREMQQLRSECARAWPTPSK